MTNWLHKLSNNLDSNWAPLEVVIVAGWARPGYKTSYQPAEKRIGDRFGFNIYGWYVKLVKSLGWFSKLAKSQFIMTKDFSGPATFARSALIRDVDFHAMPNESDIDKWLCSSMR